MRGELDEGKKQAMLSVSGDRFKAFNESGAQEAGSIDEWVELLNSSDADALEGLANILASM